MKGVSGRLLICCIEGQAHNKKSSLGEKQRVEVISGRVRAVLKQTSRNRTNELRNEGRDSKFQIK